MNPAERGAPGASASRRALLLGLGTATAAHRDLAALGQFAAVMSPVLDLRNSRLGAEIAAVDQVALLSAQQRQAELADRRVRNDGDSRLQAAAYGFRVGPGDQLDLTVEHERETRQ